MRDDGFTMTRTLEAMIEVVDRRTMERIARAWQYDDIPTTRRPAMKRYLRACQRVTFNSLLPFLRVEQLQEACRMLRVGVSGDRDALRARLIVENGVDLLGLSPGSRKTRGFRRLMKRLGEQEEMLSECEFLEQLAAVVGREVVYGEDCSDEESCACSAEKPAKPRKRQPRKRTPTRAVPAGRGLAAVGGMKELKRLLMEQVILPLRQPEVYRKYGLTVPNGILLYGPPGCGKTYIVERLAEELGVPLIRMASSSVGSSLIHETAGNIAKAFAGATKQAPALLFIDEIDALLPARRDLDGNAEHKAEEVNELLAQINNAGERGIIVIGATNEKDKLDPAALRPGRFDRQFHVGLPDDEAREEIIRLELAHRHADEAVDLADIVRRTRGFTCADLKLLVDNAAHLALKAEKPIGEWFLRRAVEEWGDSN